MNGVDPVITFQIRKIKPSHQIISRNVPFVSMIFELKNVQAIGLAMYNTIHPNLELENQKDRLMSWPT